MASEARLCAVHCVDNAEPATPGYTATIIVAGGEILKGRIADTNSTFMCDRFRRIGVTVSRIAVVPDDEVKIADEVRSASRDSTFVVTCGGVGPTHDDVTYKAVGRAFGEPLVPHPEFEAILRGFFKVPEGGSVDEYPALKMAVVPRSAKLNFLEKTSGRRDSPFPIVSCRNVFVFPGVPEYLRRGFVHLEYLFADHRRRLYSEDVLVRCHEVTQVAPVLNRAVGRFGDVVAFGSYPRSFRGGGDACTKITMESYDSDKIGEAVGFFEAEFPGGTVSEIYDDELIRAAAVKLARIRNASSDPSLAKSLSPCEKEIQKPIEEAMKEIEKILKQFQVDQVCLAFNGGKDCTALLYLLLIALQTRSQSGAESPADVPRLKILYFRRGDRLPEMERFVLETKRRFGLELMEFGGPLEIGLENFKLLYPNITAVFTGALQEDESVRQFQFLSWMKKLGGELKLVSPLFEWNYDQVWSFLCELSLPYCRLYDRGYTSLCAQRNARPNEELRYVDVNEQERYKPAYLWCPAGKPAC